jgi:hypothetical protein
MCARKKKYISSLAWRRALSPADEAPFFSSRAFSITPALVGKAFLRSHCRGQLCAQEFSHVAAEARVQESAQTRVVALAGLVGADQTA